MSLAPRPHSTAADLLRLLAVWLAAIVLAQGIAAAQALGRGPLHRHAPALAAAHGHHHDAAERHHHAAAEAGVLAVTVGAAEPAFDSAAFALVAALALMALSSWRVAVDARRHVRHAAPLRAWRSTTTAPLLKPPRTA